MYDLEPFSKIQSQITSMLFMSKWLQTLVNHFLKSNMNIIYISKDFITKPSPNALFYRILKVSVNYTATTV